MPLTRVSRSEPLAKEEFHSRLRDWLEYTDDPLIGDEEVDERTAWVWIEDGPLLTKLHADTTRAAVTAYLDLVARNENRLRWCVVQTQRGRPGKIAFGGECYIIPGFYLYLADALVGKLPLGSTGDE
jgi:hypothetical protein